MKINISISAQEGDFQAEAAGRTQKWFDALPKKEQKQYLADNPNSKFNPKNKKSGAKTKSVSKPMTVAQWKKAHSDRSMRSAIKTQGDKLAKTHSVAQLEKKLGALEKKSKKSEKALDDLAKKKGDLEEAHYKLGAPTDKQTADHESKIAKLEAQEKKATEEHFKNSVEEGAHNHAWRKLTKNTGADVTKRRNAEKKKTAKKEAAAEKARKAEFYRQNRRIKRMEKAGGGPGVHRRIDSLL